jgi:hypothetical protein
LANGLEIPVMPEAPGGGSYEIQTFRGPDNKWQTVAIPRRTPSWGEKYGSAAIMAGTSLTGLYMTKQSSDKAIKLQEESTAAQLQRSDEATARTAALQEEYFATAEEDAGNRVKVSSVWN